MAKAKPATKKKVAPPRRRLRRHPLIRVMNPMCDANWDRFEELLAKVREAMAEIALEKGLPLEQRIQAAKILTGGC